MTCTGETSGEAWCTDTPIQYPNYARNMITNWTPCETQDNVKYTLSIIELLYSCHCNLIGLSFVLYIFFFELIAYQQKFS